jgi:UDP-N-acetylmuramate--alanine ligase
VSSADLAREIPGAVFCTTFDELVRDVAAQARPGDLILTVGAGELDSVAERLARMGEGTELTAR